MDLQFPVLCSSKPMKPGSEIFQRIPITTNVFKLGRGHHNTVILPYKCLSKDHCIFKKAEEEWILENCSYSSIKVNGNKLRKGETRKLCDQDIIKLDSTNELVYTFMENAKARRKRRKCDDDSLNDNVVRKKSVSPKSDTQNKYVANDTHIVKEQIMSEQSKEEKEIYDDYAARVEKLKGSKKVVKRQKGLLRMRRNTQLELVRVRMEEKMAFLMARETEPLNENKLSKETQQGHGDQKGASKEKLGQSEARREQDRLRAKEKKELRKLRRETRQLKLDKDKRLKELEKQKLRREKELQEELNKVNKKLAKERELHEKEKMRVKQLLNQKKEELKKVTPSTSSDPKLDVESELQCSICSELFVRATTLGCSHSFCRYCIRKWTANKKECPICRATITSECRSIVLDSLVEKLADTEEAKRKRQELVKARDELEAKEPTVTLTRVTRQQNPFVAIIPDFMYDENSDSSYHRRESSLEPDSDMLVPMDTDSEPSGFDDSASTVSDEHFEDGYGEYESESQENENYDEAQENDEDEEHDDNEDNYDEGEHSPSENDEQEEHDTEEYNEGDETAPENDEGENSATENDGGENSESENDEGENSASENYDEEQSAPEYDAEEISEPENYEENSEPDDNDEGENSEPEEYEVENSEPENSAPEYNEGDNSGAESYDEDDNSAPEYGGDSYPDDSDNDDNY